MIVKTDCGTDGSFYSTSRDTCLQNVEYGGWGRTLLSGWGRVQEGGDWSRNLKRARLPIVTDQECTRNVSGD